MEIKKVKILRENSIDRGYNSNTYGTLTATSFYINVMLTSDVKNMGIFTDLPTITNDIVSNYFTNDNRIITGNTESRLNDVRTFNNLEPYIIDFDINRGTYINYRNKIIDGVSRVTQLKNPITYTIDTDKNDINIGSVNQESGILYRDYTGTTETTVVSFSGQGINSTNSSLSAITKDEYLIGIISKPEIKNPPSPVITQVLLFLELPNCAPIAAGMA